MEWEPERLRELAARRAGDGPSGSAYDPELLEALTDAADQIERLENLISYIEDGEERIMAQAAWRKANPNATPEERAAFEATWRPEMDANLQTILDVCERVQMRRSARS